MSKDEFKDSLFDLLNESDDIPIEDIETDDRNNSFGIFWDDGTRFLIRVDNY